ncbi:MAG: HelD family protein [Propionibacteriaceae bacterium]
MTSQHAETAHPVDHASPAAASPGGVDEVYARELATEQAHVDAVYARLAEATRHAQQIARDGQSRHRSDRQSYLREEDGTGMLERDVFAFQAAKRLATLDAEHEGLVFGRLDRTDGEVRYIGRIGVRDAEYEPLVIDWRAPAAEPFYRATPAEPMQIRRRRVLRSRGVRVIGIEDDLLDASGLADGDDSGLAIIGEGALLAALSRARGHTMRDIVATIQAEQDEAIRAPYQGVTMISGGPGTGKTVVALHRAAYLLYSHRRRLESGGVLVVGPSQVFMNYIERVLPSLGEDSVTLRPIGSVQVDAVPQTGVAVDTAEVAAVKGRAAMARVLRRLAGEPPTGAPTELRVVVRGEVLVVEAERLERIRRDLLSRGKLNRSRSAAETALVNALWSSRPSELEVDREIFDEIVTEAGAFARFVLAWWPYRTAVDVLHRLADPAVARQAAGTTLRPEEIELLSASYHPDQLGGAPAITIADGALLDELVELLGPVPDLESSEVDLFFDAEEMNGRDVRELVTTADTLSRQREVDPFAEPHRTYAHILVDEAQDITPMQWRMLRRRGPAASWTIVGDPAQSSWPVAAEARQALEQTIGGAPLREFRMSTNYRSPAEVFDLAARVIVNAYPEADLPTAVRSTGIQPDLQVARDGDVIGTAVRAAGELFELVEGTIGVIVPPSAITDVELAASQDPALDSARLAVVTPLQAKGLEYDAVVVVEPDRIVAESPGGLRVLYVALTRPTQRLVTVDAAPDAAWRRSLG